MRFKRLIYIGLAVIALAIAGAAASLWASLPQQDGEVPVAGLRAKVEISADALGIPHLKADRRDDAFLALGWVHARDRLFQMELMRRKGAGRLAELFGEAALELDKRQRAYGFTQAAAAILQALPEPQKHTLAVYAQGVNAYIGQASMLPPEFLLLRHRPEPWKAEDSLLVGLGMFQTLNATEDEERMLTVMEQALPEKLLRFLTPDVDEYATVLVGGKESLRPAQPIPLDEWASLGQAARADNGVDALGAVAGSNNWVVAGAKTRDGRAIVADDMHLSLGVPNIWHRASLHYAGHDLDGVTLPGLPLLIVGSNGHLAWGFTNVEADVLDLVRLELNPANPDEYRTPQGWKAFDIRRETFGIKGGGKLTVEMRGTVWGPVSPRPLLGQPVALHWTALQADGLDLGLIGMDEAQSLEQGIAVMNRFAGPTQNVALADDKGRIGWTLLGRYPLRRGFDGSASRSWANGATGWDGYIPPDKLPRLLDPPQGFIATANNRTVGRDYPYTLAHNQANGYRAHRIAERLAEMRQISEQDLLALQLDTRSEFFEFYRDLALQALDADALRDAQMQEAKRSIAAWNGHMDADSLGIALLWHWREKLVATVFAPVVARCRQVEPDFHYGWRELETPLRALLRQKLPQTLPASEYRDWRELLLKTLAETAADLKRQYGAPTLDGLAWGKVNRFPIRHPFSKSMPSLSALLDMEPKDVSGCAGFCVRIVGNGHGASERLVISPNHPEQGILHMPAGQSGHPLSAHYRDQHPAWLDGIALPFLPGQPEHGLVLAPQAAP